MLVLLQVKSSSITLLAPPPAGQHCSCSLPQHSGRTLLFLSQVNPKTGYIDYDKLEENARLFHPKLIIAGKDHTCTDLPGGTAWVGVVL